jgi:hypothetical protein
MYIQNFWHTNNQTCQLTPSQMLANLSY